MRTLGVILLGGLAMLAVGCGRPTGYVKEVTVQKNAEGNIESITVVERIEQLHRAPENEWKYLDE